MKKIFALLLCLAMIFSLAACGNDVDPEDIRGEQNVNAGNDANDDATNDADAPPTANKDADAEKEFDLGTTAGLNYENQFIGIGCNLSSDWTFYTDEQIRQLNSSTTELAGDDFKELMKNAALVYDMYASSANQTDNINVILEKQTPAIVAALDFDKNFETLFPTLKESFENMGYTNIAYTFTDVVIDGETFPGVLTTAEISGIAMYQKQFMVKCSSGYLATCTITTFTTDNTDTVLADFYLSE